MTTVLFGGPLAWRRFQVPAMPPANLCLSYMAYAGTRAFSMDEVIEIDEFGRMVQYADDGGPMLRTAHYTLLSMCKATDIAFYMAA